MSFLTSQLWKQTEAGWKHFRGSRKKASGRRAIQVGSSHSGLCPVGTVPGSCQDSSCGSHKKQLSVGISKKALFLFQSLTTAWSMFSVKWLYSFSGTHYSLDINSLLAGVPCRGKQCLGGQVVNCQMTSPWAIRLAVQLCWCHAADCFKVYVCDITVSVTITVVEDG